MRETVKTKQHALIRPIHANNLVLINCNTLSFFAGLLFFALIILLKANKNQEIIETIDSGNGKQQIQILINILDDTSKATVSNHTIRAAANSKRIVSPTSFNRNEDYDSGYENDDSNSDENSDYYSNETSYDSEQSESNDDYGEEEEWEYESNEESEEEENSYNGNEEGT